MAAAPPSLEEELRTLAIQASQLPSPLLHSIPPGTSLLTSPSHTSNFISASIAFIDQSLHLINDLSSSIQLLINQSASQAATESGTTSIHQGGAGPVIDEEMREEAVRNAREAIDRFEQMEEKGKDSDEEKDEGNKSSKKKKPCAASDGVSSKKRKPCAGSDGVRGSTSSNSGRVRSRRSDSNKGITVHFPGEHVSDHFDRYTWRKYGEKKIYGKEKRRGYYRCTLKHEKGCEAMKRVQACEAPLQGYFITYINDHTCGSGSILDNPVIGALRGRGTCDDIRNMSRMSNIDCMSPNTIHASMPLLADHPADLHCPIDGSNASGSPYRRTLADPHCTINEANTGSPYHRSLLHINTAITLPPPPPPPPPPTTTPITNANITAAAAAAAISESIDALALYGGELTSLLHPFTDPAFDYIKPAVTLDYINPTPSCHGADHLSSPRLTQQTACSQDQLAESINSSTPSSSKHSTDDQEVTFEPSDLDDIIRFHSWPYAKTM